MCFALFSTFRHRESNSRTLQTRLPQISFHDFQKCKPIFSSDPHTKIDFFWFFSDYFIESLSLTTTRKFLFRFYFIYFLFGGFSSASSATGLRPQIVNPLVLKKWICSLTRLVIMWSAVTCHRFLQIFVQNCPGFALPFMFTKGKKIGAKEKNNKQTCFCFSPIIPLFPSHYLLFFFFFLGNLQARYSNLHH